MHTFGVKEWDDAQLTLCHIKRVLQVMPGIGVLQLIKVNQVRPKDKARSSEGAGGHGINVNRGAPAGCKDHGQKQGDGWAGEVRIQEHSRGRCEHAHVGELAAGVTGI